MTLSNEEKFVIDSIALYTFYYKYEKRGIISKQSFTNFYESLTNTQEVIISYYTATETEFFSKASEILSAGKTV